MIASTVATRALRAFGLAAIAVITFSQPVLAAGLPAPQKGDKIQFRDQLAQDKQVAAHLTAKELNACFDAKFYIRHARRIWKRVLAA